MDWASISKLVQDAGWGMAAGAVLLVVFVGGWKLIRHMVESMGRRLDEKSQEVIAAKDAHIADLKGFNERFETLLANNTLAINNQVAATQSQAEATNTLKEILYQKPCLLPEKQQNALRQKSA